MLRLCFSVNRSEGDINLSELSLSSVGSPGAGDMGFQSPRLNGKVHRHSNTPRSSRYHHSSVCILFSILLIGQLRNYSCDELNLKYSICQIDLPS